MHIQGLSSPRGWIRGSATGAGARGGCIFFSALWLLRGGSGGWHIRGVFFNSREHTVQLMGCRRGLRLLASGDGISLGRSGEVLLLRVGFAACSAATAESHAGFSV